MPESFAFRITGVEPHDAAWRNASESLRREFWRAVVVIGLQVKDKELALGLDRHGRPMKPISAYTRAHRRSAMGPADPNAPPLTPAYGPSRTRSLLTGRAHKNYAEFYWRFDEVLGMHWGKMLGWHRSGSTRLPKRDVIGISPRSLTEVRHQAQVWWSFRQRGVILDLQVNQFQLPTPPVVTPAKIPVVGRTDFANFTFGINGDLSLVERATAAGTFTGFRQFHPPAAGVKAAKEPILPVAAAAKVHQAHPFPPKPNTPKPGTPAKLPVFRPFLPKVDAAKAKPLGPSKIKPPRPKPPSPSAPSIPLPPPVPKPKPQPKPVAAVTPKPVVPPSPAPKPTSGPFPARLGDLAPVQVLGGSTGAELVRDKSTGKLFVQKKGGNAAHLREEVAADAAYAALGIPVARSQVFSQDGRPVKIAEFLEGKTLAELRSSDPKAYLAAREEVRKNFVADALLGNWDVVGLNADNILVTPDGTVVRIDNGGALRYRAQGAKKTLSQWSAKLDELDSMRDPMVNPSAASIFNGLTDAEVRTQAKAVLAKRAALLAAAPKELHATLEARLKTLERIAEAKPATVAEPLKFKAFGTINEMEEWGAKHYGPWAENLTRDERRSLIRYSGEMHKEMNKLLRGTLKDDDIAFGASRQTVQSTIDFATVALKKAGTPEDIVGYRGIEDFTTMGFASLDDLKPGDKYTEKGFSSVTLNIEKAKTFAYSLGGDATKAVVFKINTPKGSTGAYLNAGELSVYGQERELLFPPNAEYRVVGHGKPVEQQGKMLPVVILERIQ